MDFASENDANAVMEAMDGGELDGQILDIQISRNQTAMQMLMKSTTRSSRLSQVFGFS